ncbi:MATALPHA1 [Maudiozyma saulgeensis]|uniref:MATALPHA1 n=1 Tax=Maudiozyma saulgeensis TaxID=1789683 RepID=A0A1X7R337_9SACH|nr:MATALPHA1 [Kazachstania saulgeensis]
MLSSKASFKVNLTKKKSKSLRPKTISKIKINDKRIINKKKLNYSTSEFVIGPNLSQNFIPNPNIIDTITYESNIQQTNTFNNILNNIYSLNNLETLIMDPVVYPPGLSMNIMVKKQPSDICQNRKLNAFIAFRIYYSQFGKGLKQNTLSNILSRIWHSNEKEQRLWNRLTQEFCRKK